MPFQPAAGAARRNDQVSAGGVINAVSTTMITTAE
jgi:hypothetical protein